MIQFKASYLKQLKHFIGFGDIRYYLRGVHIEPYSEGGAILVATDGHCMMVVIDKDAIVTEPKTFYVNQDLFKHCSSDENKCLINEETQRLEIVGVAGNELFIQPGKCFVEENEKIKFPDFRKVIPDFELLKPIMPSYVSANILDKLNKVNLMKRAKTFPIRFWSNEEIGTTIIIQFEFYPEILVAMMPCRGYDHVQSMEKLKKNFKFNPAKNNE